MKKTLARRWLDIHTTCRMLFYLGLGLLIGQLAGYDW